MADVLAVPAIVISGTSAIASVVALAQARKARGDQQKVALLLPRLEAYDSAVTIGRQLGHLAVLRRMAKAASDEVEAEHAVTGSTRPNHFAAAYEKYSEDLKNQTQLLDVLREHSYFPDDMSRAIQVLTAAAKVRNDVSYEVVSSQSQEIRSSFRRLQAVHADITKVE